MLTTISTALRKFRYWKEELEERAQDGKNISASCIKRRLKCSKKNGKGEPGVVGGKEEEI